VQLAVSRQLYGKKVLACANYSGTNRSVVLGFKDHGHYRIAPFLAQALAAILDPLMRAHPGAVIVPVPSSIRGRLRRGIEPTLTLARELGRHRPTWTIRRLLRPEHPLTTLLDPPSKGMSKRERLASPRGFRLSASTGDRPIILLDDVVTTGSTLESCARTCAENSSEVVAAVALVATPRTALPAQGESVNRR
jgi:predicted amidophosphoribosyltransferase